MMPPKTHPNTTILVIVTGLLVLYYFFNAPILVTIATLTALLSLVFPRIGSLIEQGWYKLAEMLGYVNTRVLLSIVFFLVLFPVALLSRMFGNSSMKLRRSDDTVFTVRDHHYSKKDFENMW